MSRKSRLLFVSSWMGGIVLLAGFVASTAGGVRPLAIACGVLIFAVATPCLIAAAAYMFKAVHALLDFRGLPRELGKTVKGYTLFNAEGFDRWLATQVRQP